MNLRAARKAQKRAEDRAKADANAAKFGRTKGEKARAAAEAEKLRGALDGHKRDTPARD